VEASRGRPGSRSLSFASPKESKQRKGDRKAVALPSVGSPNPARASRVGDKLAFGSNMSPTIPGWHAPDLATSQCGIQKQPQRQKQLQQQRQKQLQLQRQKQQP
jgi:hypothetical protein